MKFLAIEKSVSPGPIPEDALKLEARKVLEYFESGIIENIYFNDNHDAVLIFNSENSETAQALLNGLPLVTGGYISFDIMTLHPYTGFSRLRN